MGWLLIPFNTTLLVAGLAGALVAVFFRAAAGPALLLLIPAVFFVLSRHSGASDLYVPALWPHTPHNTRYGIAAFVFVAAASSGFVALLPMRRWTGSVVLVGVAMVHDRADMLEGCTRQPWGAVLQAAAGLRPGAPAPAEKRWR